MSIDFSVMTWNVENLFPLGHAFGPTDPDVFATKMSNLVQTIRNISPHVVGLQEVGSEETFAELSHRLQPDYPHAELSEHPDGRGIRVGFISKFPLSNRDELVNFPATALSDVTNGEGGILRRLGRGALKVTAQVTADLQINLVNAHLKSKLVTYPGGRRSPRDENERALFTGVALLKRTAEAVALRFLINALITGNDVPLILLGDFNDGPQAETNRILTGPEELSLARPDRFDDVRLYNLVEYIPADRRYSRIYRSNREMIDHLMVSYELIFHQQVVDSFVEPITSIDQSVRRRQDATFPDHAPVFARFRLPED